MAHIKTEDRRFATGVRLAMRRRVVEWLMLCAAGLAFFFALGIAFNFING